MMNKDDYLRQIINSSNGKFISIFFRKVSTGEIRCINGRVGVKIGVKGKGLPYDRHEKNIVIIYDIKDKRHKAIRLDTIKTIISNKKRITVR